MTDSATFVEPFKSIFKHIEEQLILLTSSISKLPLKDPSSFLDFIQVCIEITTRCHNEYCEDVVLSRNWLNILSAPPALFAAPPNKIKIFNDAYLYKDIRRNLVKLFLTSIWGVYDNLLRIEVLLAYLLDELVTAVKNNKKNSKSSHNLIGEGLSLKSKFDFQDVFSRLFYEIRHFFIHCNNSQHSKTLNFFFSDEISLDLPINPAVISAMHTTKKNYSNWPKELDYIKQHIESCTPLPMIELFDLLEEKATSQFTSNIDKILEKLLTL